MIAVAEARVQHLKSIGSYNNIGHGGEKGCEAQQAGQEQARSRPCARQASQSSSSFTRASLGHSTFAWTLSTPHLALTHSTRADYTALQYLHDTSITH